MVKRGASTHIPAIDMVKGWAIIGVTLIHSQALGQSPWMTLLFFHAVPVFIVLFGMNSEQWFARRPPAGRVAIWYQRALVRIMVPAWAALSVWWAMALTLRPPLAKLSLGMPFYHVLGYLKNVGAGWFITVIVQLVLVFPLLRWIARRFGIATLLALGFACTVIPLVFVQNMRAIFGVAGWIYFSPRLLLHVAFGILLAPYARSLGWRAALIALLAFAAFAPVSEQLVLAQPYWRIATRLEELPLTVVLLVAMGSLAAIAPLRIGLSWLGLHSFGLYLGQLITHNAFLFVYGGECNPYGCAGGLYDRFDPWVYTGILAIGSVAWLAVGNALLRAIADFRARGYPLPDLST
jgi:peptidoglycan/LPS O-acetylase OafA/YrhL